MEMEGLFIITSFFTGGMILPVYFLVRLMKWMKDTAGTKRRTNILRINLFTMMAYSCVLAGDDLGYFLVWFMIGVMHLAFFLFYIEMDLLKKHQSNKKFIK